MNYLNSHRFRAAAYQIAYIGLLLAIVVTLALTARHNLTAQGITSGFGFLDRSTGWEMSFSLLETDAGDTYRHFLIAGFLNTVVIGMVGLACATIIGGVIGLARISSNLAAQLMSTIYVEIFRNVPLILQLFFWYSLFGRLPSPRQSFEVGSVYLNNRGLFVPGFNVSAGVGAAMVGLLLLTLILVFALPMLPRVRQAERSRRKLGQLTVLIVGLVANTAVLGAGHEPGTTILSHPELRGLNFKGGVRIQPEVYTLVFGLALYGGAFVAEIVRGGFQAVGIGQVEAAQSLGLGPWRVFAKVRLPLAFRSMLPILTNQYIWLIKATTLGAVVGFSDIFAVVVTGITQSGQTLEFIAILMGGFLLLNFTLAKILNAINGAIALKGN